MSIEKIVENFNKKYGTDDYGHYLRSMIYFDDVEEESWKSIKMLNDTLKADDIKCKLIQEVTKYEKNILLQAK